MAGPPKILLLQARLGDDPVRDEERQAFEEISRYDALMVGGSGEFYVSKGDFPGFTDLLGVLRRVVDAGHPTFASCFDFQTMVVALGGEIVFDGDDPEVGTYELTLTDDGVADPLLGRLPRHFMAQVGRKDRAKKLPPGVVHLASSERCPYHSFRVPDKPIWATQFHPELTVEENRLRFKRYLSGYAPHMNEAEVKEAMKQFQDSPATRQLIPAFLKLVFG